MSSAMKFATIAVVVFSFLIFTPVNVHAQAVATSLTFSAQNQWNASILWIMSAFGGCIGGSGSSLMAGETCDFFKPDGTVQLYSQLPEGGALTAMGKGIVAMYQAPPLSSTYYLADMGANMGIVQPAFAQSIGGSGDSVLQPVLQIWAITRNISYIGFVLVFITIGFMIMFRQKLNPQTVITVQSALPTLVVGMILVTFSYFIAALFVDLSFVAIQVIATVFANAGQTPFGDLPKAAAGTNVLALFGQIVFNNSTFSHIKDPIQQSFSGLFTDNSYIPGVNSGVGQAIAGFIGGGAGVVVIFILVVALFIQMIRLMWGLVQAYLNLIINTIFGPFFILVSTIPGRSSALSFWWKGLLGNALIFPAVFAAFLIAGIILGNADSNFTQTPPLLQNFPAILVRTILAYGLILSTPTIPGVVKNILGVKDAGEFAKAAIAGVGTGLAVSNSARNATGKAVFGGLQSQKKHYQENLNPGLMGDDRAGASLVHSEESMRMNKSFNTPFFGGLRKAYVRGFGRSAAGLFGRGSTQAVRNITQAATRTIATDDGHEVQAGFSRGFSDTNAGTTPHTPTAATPSTSGGGTGTPPTTTTT